jgi:hypothetical protein
MITITISDDSTGTRLESSYDTTSQLCGALIQNMPNLGRHIQRVGLEQTIRDLMVAAQQEIDAR